MLSRQLLLQTCQKALFVAMVCLLLCGSNPASGRSIENFIARETASTFKLNNLPIGFIPQHDASPTPMADINFVLSQTAKDGSKTTFRSATYGWYAQVYPGLPFKGEQLLKIKDDVIKSGAIFETAIMPLRSYEGFTAQNPSQAIAVAKVLQQFTKAGVQIRLRFGHEMNYYGASGKDKIYSNDTIAFKEAFKQMSIAAKKYCQNNVQMVFNPNEGNLTEIDRWAPDPSTYSLIALDYYAPTKASLTVQSYLSVVSPFYQKYGQNGKKPFIICETSIRWNSTIDDRLQWLRILSDPSLRKTLPSLQSLTWFNLKKDYPFDIIYPPKSIANAPFVKMMAKSMIN